MSFPKTILLLFCFYPRSPEVEPWVFRLTFSPFPSNLQLLDAKTTCPCGGGGIHPTPPPFPPPGGGGGGVGGGVEGGGGGGGGVKNNNSVQGVGGGQRWGV